MGKSKQQIRKEKEEKKEARNALENKIKEQKIDKKRSQIDLAKIKKELNLFYKFMDKFISTLSDFYFKESVSIEEDPDKILRPFLPIELKQEINEVPKKDKELEVLEEIEELEELEEKVVLLEHMSDLEVYNSFILQYAIHFNTEIGQHRYNLNNNISELFVGRNDKFILTPNSSFELVEKYNLSDEKQKNKIVVYLQNMEKITSRLNEQIDYDVITYILQKDKANTASTNAIKKDMLEFYSSVSKAKKALISLTDDNSGVIDSIVDTAANEFRGAQSEMQMSMNGDDETEFKDHGEFIDKNKNLLKKVTSNVTNAFGNKLADGAINADDFSKLANKMMDKLGRSDKRKMEKLGLLDIKKLKELQSKHKGNFAKAVNIDSVFDDVLKKVNIDPNEKLD